MTQPNQLPYSDGLESSSPGASSTAETEVAVFYDGACPLCRREIAMLQRWDKRRAIEFVDISDPRFDAQQFGVSWDQLMAEIHGRLPDGTWIRGVEVFRRLYAAVGWRRAVELTRLPVISSILDFGYRIFAKHRLRLTGRCHGKASCVVVPK